MIGFPSKIKKNNSFFSVGKLLILFIIVALVLVACGGEDPTATPVPEEAEAAPTEAPEEEAEEAAGLTVPRVALTSPTQPSYVETIYGPITYGSEFGLDMTLDDFTIFDSHATATQSALAGQADIVGGSLVSHLLVREAGADFKVFCSFINLDDFVIAGRNGVTEVDQLFDPDVRVAVDSPGGAAEIILNAMLQGLGTGKTVADIPNQNILESSGLRTSAFVADEVDATVIHLGQFKQAAEEVSDAVIITTLYGDAPVFVKEAYAAPADWLDENLDSATAFCASVIKASRELPADFDLYLSAVDEFVGEPPEEEVLREIFDLVSQYDFWPPNGLDPEAITFMAEMAVTAGVLQEVPDVADVLDLRPIEGALELLGGEVAAPEPPPEPEMADLPVPRVALTSPTQPSYVETIYGPITYGSEFGLDMTLDDFTIFDSHATATQSALAGQADIVGGSFVSHLLVREAGADFKVFCSFINLDDFVIAGRNGVTEVDQLFDPDVRVAVDSPGGAAEIILNAMLQGTGTGKTVADIPNQNILESSGLRTSAFVADEVDATVIHLGQFKQAAEEVSDAVIITTLYGDAPVFIKEAYAAPADWLDENLDTATAFCASVIKASRELPADFDLYLSAVDEFVGEPPDEEVLREIFDLVSEYDFWPADGGLDPEAITFMAEMAVTAGVLQEVPDPADVLDPRAIEGALELLRGQ